MSTMLLDNVSDARCWRSGLAAEGKSEFGLIGVVGGMMVIELLAGKMRLVRGGIAAMGNEHYCGNLLW